MIRLVLSLTVILIFSMPITTNALSNQDLLTQIQSLLRIVEQLQQQLSELNTSPSAPKVLTTTNTKPLFCPSLSTIRFGIAQHSPKVIQLQQFLKSTGDFTYPEFTTYYGTQTKLAVQRYQKRNNIVTFGTPSTTGYGLAGPGTRRRMCTIQTVVKRVAESRPIVVPNTTPQQTTNIPDTREDASLRNNTVLSHRSIEEVSTPTPPASCGSSPSGTTQTRIRYQNATELFGTECRQEDQVRVCTDGSWRGWSGGYSNSSCTLLDKVSKKYLQNAVRIGAGTIVPLSKKTNILRGFNKTGSSVSSYNEDGIIQWNKSLGDGVLFGGFDFNNDGYVDFGLEKSVSIGTSCGSSLVRNRWLEFYSGENGSKISEVSPISDKCWNNLGYASVSWTSSGVLFGQSGTLALAPQYHSQGWFFRDIGGSIRADAYIFPNNESFSATYNNDTTNYIKDSQPQNGIIVKYGGIDRLILFTSEKVLQYGVGALDSAQLIFDNFFKARTDIAGRNYGLVSSDPQDKSNIALVAGASAKSVFDDMSTNTIVSDPWAGIERHISLYDIASNSIKQRFFSYAHDNSDGNKYQNRIIYPAHALLPSVASRSHILFNNFVDGHWQVTITQPGSVNTEKQIQDMFVWDVRDVDGDGEVEIFASKSDTSRSSSVGSYFLKWETEIYSWNKSTKQLALRQVEPGIPYLLPAPKETLTSNSTGYSFPVLIGKEDNVFGLYTYSSDAEINFKELTY